MQKKNNGKWVTISTIIMMVVFLSACEMTGGSGGNGGDNNSGITCPAGQIPVALWIDLDHDGVADDFESTDVCVGNTTETPEDTTENPAPPVDNCVGVWNPGQDDTDKDGIGNACDSCPNDKTNTCTVIDTDKDGVPDITDCAPLDASKWTIGEIRPDGDFDTIPNTDAPKLECMGTTTPTGWTRKGLPLDNCPAIANTDQVDTDHDGVGDACETGVCVSKLRIGWKYNVDSTVLYYNASATSCYAAFDEYQDPAWQLSPFIHCNDPANGCVIEDEVSADTKANTFCEWNNYAPEGYPGEDGNPANPLNPFGPPGDFRNWVVTPLTPGSDEAFNALPTGYPIAEYNPDCTTYVRKPVVVLCHPWGCNIKIYNLN